MLGQVEQRHFYSDLTVKLVGEEGESMEVHSYYQLVVRRGKVMVED